MLVRVVDNVLVLGRNFDISSVFGLICRYMFWFWWM